MHLPAAQLKPVAVDIDFQPYELARGLCLQTGFVFLDSASSDSPEVVSGCSSTGRISILASNPEKVIRGRWKPGGSGEGEGNSKAAANPELECLGHELRAGKALAQSFDCGFPTGGAIGWFEYDGNFCFGIYHHMLVFDHAAGQWFEIGDLRSRIDWSQIDAAHRLENPFSSAVEFTPSMDREDFCRRVERAQEYIAAGDIYQVNLSHEFSAPWPWGEGEECARASFALYEHLRERSPAPCSGYLNLNQRQVLSSSPELFLRVSGRAITTRPIKGTRPRFRDRSADERSAYELITSQKEIAELIMITDLERNDLGKICEPGSVDVSELLKLERFEQVFHLVSTVNGRMAPGIGHLDAVLACFPGGSITGAPKIRAMQIIDQLETTPRGLYTGAIGVFGFNEESIFNIAIRTAMVENRQLRFNVGAGIVADSVPALEFEETLHKARGIFQACGVNG
jgi:anthranilate/para-aminobenzoate synthase component I